MEATTVDGRKLTKNEKKRLKKKEQKNSKMNNDNDGGTRDVNVDALAEVPNNNIQIEYVGANVNDILADDSDLITQFEAIFQKFAKPEELTADWTLKATEGAEESADAANKDAGGPADEENDESKKLSKRKKKLVSRLSVAELKQLVHRPDVVEAHDVTANDPRLLVYLKAYRNSVPVPRHWCHKRKYLQGKRGIEKPPFQLPEFIAETGIAKIRDTVMEQEALRKSKQKARDKLQPKMGKIDIDYQVLHDAFFKYQTKPKLTLHGDLYYEGKEFETHVKEHKPGHISAELMACLGMQDTTVPVPWLINMQRYGPPPSYPTLRIPGLNAPIPPGAQFGYHPGGWGKPPVDEYGRPLYGDVFGAVVGDENNQYEDVDKTTRWGELVAVEEEEMEDEEEEDEDGVQASVSRSVRGDESVISGLETPGTLDGLSTVHTGLATPDIIDLRKRASAGMETPDSVYGGGNKELYQVIQERSSKAGAAAGFFGSERGYLLPGTGGDQAEGEGPDSSVEPIEGEDDGGVGADADGDDTKTGKRKRRMDSSNVAKRYKDFKF